jgi:hypothetical protein
MDLGIEFKWSAGNRRLPESTHTLSDLFLISKPVSPVCSNILLNDQIFQSFFRDVFHLVDAFLHKG